MVQLLSPLQLILRPKEQDIVAQAKTQCKGLSKKHAGLQSVTKLVDRSGVNSNNPPFPPLQCCKIKNFVLFHVILGRNALSIVFQQIYTTLKRGRGFDS